jgi:hypothetical protein
VQDHQDVVKLFALKEVETPRLIVEKMLMVMRRITRTTEGLDHNLMPRFEDGGASFLENFCGCQFSVFGANCFCC